MIAKKPHSADLSSEDMNTLLRYNYNRIFSNLLFNFLNMGLPVFPILADFFVNSFESTYTVSSNPFCNHIKLCPWHFCLVGA